jgi:(R,R)-butanediol dehydrogenase/meso-butanediol dehydrogenase/diacetyl reductase
VLKQQTGEVAEVIRMMAEGKLKGYERMVTARITLDDVVSRGFEELIHHKDDHIKIMVTPKPLAAH